MSSVLQRLKASLESEVPIVDRNLLSETVEEITELREQRDKLEEILIILVRTGLPWGEDGAPNEHFETFKTRYASAMHEASQLLGLEMRSMITRTEPRT